MKHKFAKHTSTCNSDYGCPICEGGLALCEVCDGFEDSLTSECPGEKISKEKLELVYQAKLDYKDGKWIEL